METLLSMLQDPVFSVCLFVGAFAVFMFCIDQFAKPSVSKEDTDPWNFVATQSHDVEPISGWVFRLLRRPFACLFGDFPAGSGKSSSDYEWLRVVNT